MSAPFYTSGPWELGREIGGYVDIDATHAPVKWTALARVVIETEAVNGYTRNAEAEANARLIAAAPELLEALEDVLGATLLAFPSLGHQPPVIRAVAAIAKARGQ